MAPEIKWVPEDGYKNLKVVVEIDSEIDAQTASEQELRRRHKSLGVLKIVTDRGLQVKQVSVPQMVIYIYIYIFITVLDA